MKHLFQKLYSYVSNKPVQLGYGVSFDDQISFKKDTIQEHLAESRNSARYQLSEDLGQFELIGLIHKPGRKEPLYKLRHILTGQNIQISQSLFKLFFKNINQG